MKGYSVITVLLTAFLTVTCMLPAAAEIPLGGQGWIAFRTNVEGASVYIDGDLKGTTDSTGEFDILYEPSFTDYTIKKTGYYDETGTIDFPSGATNIEIPVTLSPKPVGSGKGWITVHCNVDGASVYFGSTYKGMISAGVFTLEVSTTGTPYTTFRVSKDGYVTYEGTVPSMPADGQTVDLYATLNPVPTTATTEATPIGGDAGWYAVHCNIEGASVYFDGSYKGRITGGVLSVQVYTTATPYSRYSVEKSGYETVSGSLPTAPSKGQTKSVYVTLNRVATTSAPAGGDKGYFMVHSNVEGASVSFDGMYQGVIANGVLSVQVYTTGTPYTTFEVSKAGYSTYTGRITGYPAKGQTVDLYATLAPAHTTSLTSIPTPTPTQAPTTYAPVPVPVILAALALAVCIPVSPRIRR